MTPVRVASTAYRPLSSRRAALVTTASLAIAIMLANPDPAWAQFNGTAGANSGITSGLGTDTIVVGNATATIDWSATTNDFLPSSSTQIFTSGLGDYTVLNRVTPADPGNPIQLNGTLISYLNGATSGASNGGNIWFYSPSGIIVGSTAVFDVGGLLLTSISPTLNSNDGASNDGTDELADEGTDEATEEEKEDSEAEASAEVDVLFSLIDTAPVSLDKTIDEPVTSGGDGGPGVQ